MFHGSLVPCAERRIIKMKKSFLAKLYIFSMESPHFFVMCIHNIGCLKGMSMAQSEIRIEVY